MFRIALSVLMLALPLTACGGKNAGGPGPAGPPLPPQAIAKADEIYAQRCTPCHGNNGHGDGAASNTLTPRPRNFGDEAWQKSVTDDHIMKIIKVGGAGVGKAATMPGNPDLTDQNVLAALKNKIRGFAGK